MLVVVVVIIVAVVVAVAIVVVVVVVVVDVFFCCCCEGRMVRHAGIFLFKMLAVQQLAFGVVSVFVGLKPLTLTTSVIILELRTRY